MTGKELKQYLPKNVSLKAATEVAKELDEVEDKYGIDGEVFKEQFLSYTHLIKAGAGVKKLTNALKWVMMMQIPDMTQARAYRILFPEKVKEIEARGQQYTSFAAMYNQSKLVTEITKLQIIPTNVIYRPLFHQGIKKLVDLSNGLSADPNVKVSPTVQLEATKAYVDLVKPLEDNSIELKIGMSDEAMQAQNNLAEQLRAMAATQRAQLEAGSDIEDVQMINIKVSDGSRD